MSHSQGIIKFLFPPLHNEGVRFMGVFALGALVLTYIWSPLFWPCLLLCIWCYYFFRDPARIIPRNEDLVVAPADGVISAIQDIIPPNDLGLPDIAVTRISIFMNVFNCHVNRSPVSGVVEQVTYHEGQFFNASLDKASEHNERNSLRLRLSNGQLVGVVQIAGLVARRIVCYAHAESVLQIGQRFGIIRFGSRVDVYLPSGIQPLVSVGQTIIGGETVLANLQQNAIATEFIVD